jgi:hypothetical protein
MGHAHHFLSRLDRLTDPRQLEDAKRLYNNVGILNLILNRAQLPLDCERVAVSLADPVSGPWVIATRSGRFITCLATGMRPAANDVRIPPHLVRAVFGAIATANRYVDAFARYESRSGESREKGLLGWVLKRPEQVSLEDARALVGLMMLAPDLAVGAVHALHTRDAATIVALSRTRRPHSRKRLRAMLHTTRLSLAHLHAAMHAVPNLEPTPAEPAVLTPSMLAHAERFVAHSPPVAVRGLWTLRTYPRLDAECLEILRAGDPRRNASHIFAVGVASLVATESLARGENLTRVRELIGALPIELRSGLLAQYAQQALSDADAAIRLAVEMARAVRAQLMSGFADQPADGKDVSDQSALAAFYTFPHSRVDDNADLVPWLVAAMPHFLRAPFEHLYMPAAELEAIRAASSRVRAGMPCSRDSRL